MTGIPERALPLKVSARRLRRAPFEVSDSRIRPSRDCITFDPAKRAVTLAEHGLDFARPTEVFADRHLTARDLRG